MKLFQRLCFSFEKQVSVPVGSESPAFRFTSANEKFAIVLTPIRFILLRKA